MSELETKQIHHDQLQQIANKHQLKVYVYLLENGNRFSTVDPMRKNEMIGGSKVDKLMEVIKPQKS